jgi:hypothetical protein
MLMQNFKSAADLGISEPQKEALMKTLVLLETGRLVHVRETELDYSKAVDRRSSFTGHFNMMDVFFEHKCGTVACIKGTAELISGVTVGGTIALDELFYTNYMNGRDITPDQAAVALRSYLTTGDARWDLAVAA